MSWNGTLMKDDYETLRLQGPEAETLRRGIDPATGLLPSTTFVPFVSLAV